jgi:hypothetical protein
MGVDRKGKSPVKQPLNAPFYALVATGIFVVAAVLLVIFADPENQGTAMILGIIASTLPSLVAALYSERTARDVRNGVAREQAKQGAAEAIEDAGVLTRSGPVVTTELRALQRLLEANTAATTINTAAQDVASEHWKADQP